MKVSRFFGVLFICLGCMTAFVGVAAAVLPMIQNDQLQLVLSSFAMPDDNLLVNAMNAAMTYALRNCYLVMLAGTGAALAGALILLRAGKGASAPQRSVQTRQGERPAQRPAPRPPQGEAISAWRPSKAADVAARNPFAAGTASDRMAYRAASRFGGGVAPFEAEPMNTFAPAAQRQPAEGAARGGYGERAGTVAAPAFGSGASFGSAPAFAFSAAPSPYARPVPVAEEAAGGAAGAGAGVGLGSAAGSAAGSGLGLGSAAGSGLVSGPVAGAVVGATAGAVAAPLNGSGTSFGSAPASAFSAAPSPYARPVPVAEEAAEEATRLSAGAVSGAGAMPVDVPVAGSELVAMSVSGFGSVAGAVVGAVPAPPRYVPSAPDASWAVGSIDGSVVEPTAERYPPLFAEQALRMEKEPVAQSEEDSARAGKNALSFAEPREEAPAAEHAVEHAAIAPTVARAPAASPAPDASEKRLLPGGWAATADAGWLSPKAEPAPPLTSPAPALAPLTGGLAEPKSAPVKPTKARIKSTMGKHKK